MSNPPLSLTVEPGLGNEIGDCFDHALRIAILLNVVVYFTFNEVKCGVRPRDFGEPNARDIFIRTYRAEITKPAGIKLCFANP